MRTEGVVLVGRRGDEYWFIDSVFQRNADSFGCTGVTVYPVSVEEMEGALTIDSLEERLGDVWEELMDDRINADCNKCVMGPCEEGCMFCGYPSLREFCKDVAQNHGCDAIFDCPGSQYGEALRKLFDEVETVTRSECGRIFSGVEYDDFDEVYNFQALMACLTYERGALSYDCAVRAIFDKA